MNVHVWIRISALCLSGGWTKRATAGGLLTPGSCFCCLTELWCSQKGHSHEYHWEWPDPDLNRSDPVNSTSLRLLIMHMAKLLARHRRSTVPWASVLQIGDFHAAASFPMYERLSIVSVSGWITRIV